MLWSCEKETFNQTSKPQSFVEEIQQAFNKEDFTKSIPYEFDVNWDLAKKEYSEELKTDYYEFPIRYTSSLTPHINDLKKTKGNYFNSYKIIATIKNKNINFYALRVYEKISETGQIISEVNLRYASSFNGVIHLVDKNDVIVFAKKVEKGTELIKDYYAKDLKELDPIKARAGDGCVTVKTEHWYYYYQWSQDVEVFLYSKKLLDITYEQICAYEYLPEYEEGMTNTGGGGSPSGAGTYKKDCASTTNSKYLSRASEGCAVKVTEKEVKCEKGFVMDSNGNCVKEWPEDIELFDIVDGPAIQDIVEYLKFFDSTKGATFTLYVKQPKANKSDTWSGAVWNPNVGHTFISISQENITRVIGLYPGSSVNPYSDNPSASSLLVDNAGDDFDVSLTINITASQLSTLRSEITSNNSNYNLNTNNCTDFGIKMGNLFSMNIPDSIGKWPGGGGSNPGNLGQDIRGMALNSGMTRNTTGGKAVLKSGTCQ